MNSISMGPTAPETQPGTAQSSPSTTRPLTSTTLPFKRLHPDAQLPRRGSKHAAGYDLYAIESTVLRPGQRAVIGTGVAVAIPEGHHAVIAPRSGLAVTYGLDCLAGRIDLDFRGEVKVVLLNTDDRQNIMIEKGMRIAQLIVIPVTTPDAEFVDELPDTERGTGGFGSSGLGALPGVA